MSIRLKSCATCLLVPERGRLARWMASDEPLSSSEMWRATHDLHSLCCRDLSVLFLPGHQPVGASCPVACCQLKLDGSCQTALASGRQ